MTMEPSIKRDYAIVQLIRKQWTAQEISDKLGVTKELVYGIHMRSSLSSLPKPKHPLGDFREPKFTKTAVGQMFQLKQAGMSLKRIARTFDATPGEVEYALGRRE